MVERILCIIDNAGLRASCSALRDPFVVEAVGNLDDAAAAIAGAGPFAVVLFDRNIRDGPADVLAARVRSMAPDSVRIMLSSLADVASAAAAVNEGRIFRFLIKPCAADAVKKALTAGLDQYRLLHLERELLEKTLAGCVQVMADLMGLVNPTAFGRIARLRDLVKRVAWTMAVDNAWQLELAAMLSQTGCVTVPEQILRRAHRGAELSPDELEMFANHPRLGHDLIAPIPRLAEVADAIAYQEKHFDGSSFPKDSKREAAIPLGGRILKAALDFDCLELKGLSPWQAISCMKQRKGWYDPQVLQVLAVVAAENEDRITRETSLQELTDEFDAAATSGVQEEVKLRQLLGMVLAENVWDRKGQLVLSKGHEITPTLLERMRNYARHTPIQEPIRVFVPEAKQEPAMVE
jgi:response regulator RpfG family c-di-GMP phosphodiesterase